MKVLLLSPYPERIRSAFERDEVVVPQDDCLLPQADYIVSYGYRQIFPPAFVRSNPQRIINIHAAFLPWNRGAYPNFWSWFDNTKKGLTIHYIDEGIDTGNIIFQTQITKFRDKAMTLRSTYEELMQTADLMFKWIWPSIKNGTNYSIKQPPGGSFHKIADTVPWLAKLEQGWDTPVSVVEEMGKAHREQAA